MTKRNYYKVPKKVSEITEEELETFVSSIYENMMTIFAEDQLGLPGESSESSRQELGEYRVISQIPEFLCCERRFVF